MSYPPLGGAPLRNWQNINIMIKFGEVGIFSIFNQDSPVPNIEGIKFWHHYNIEKIPFPWQQIELIAWWLNQRGLRDYWVYRDAAAQKLNEIMNCFQPNLVIFEEIWLYPYLKTVKNYPCQIIFDSHNIESLLFEKIQCSGKGLRGWIRAKIHLPQLQRDEKNFIKQVQQVWLCSQKDQSLLHSLHELNFSSFVIPNGIDVQYYDEVKLGQYLPPQNLKNNLHNLLFIGTFSYLPNSEAANWLIEEIYPQLSQIYPNCYLLLVGLKPTSLMKKAAQKNAKIIVTGKILDVRPYLATNSIVVVPLQEGSGTRLKILEAFAAGCPVISTSKGAEGLEVEDGKHLLIRDDVDSIVDGIVEIWQNPQLKQNLVNSAYEIVNLKYSWQSISSQVAQALKLI